MKRLIKLFLIVSFITLSLFGADGKALAAQLNLKAGTKAIVQWKRVFKKKRKMKRYGIDKLSDADKQALKEYLIAHAADSDTPEVAGM